MKKTIHLVTLLLLVACTFCFSKKLGVLPDVAKPFILKVDCGQVYIVDRTVKVHWYSLNNLKYQGQISKLGEGPSEMKFVSNMDVHPNSISLYGMGKLAFFSSDGSYIEEFLLHKTRPEHLTPFGKNYVGRIYEKSNGRNFNPYHISLFSYSKDQGLVFKKMLYYYEIPHMTKTNGKRDYKILHEYQGFSVYKDKVYIGDSSKGMYIEVFDLKGKQVRRINVPGNKVKVSSEYKKVLLDALSRSPYYRMAEGMYNIVIPEYFPGFYRFSVSDDKIYFLTYIPKDRKREVVVTDLKGKLLKRICVPWVNNFIYTNYCIENEKFYYIKENEDDEEWEQHAVDLK